MLKEKQKCIRGVDMSYIFYNPNPIGVNVGDCSAIIKVWKDISARLQ